MGSFDGAMVGGLMCASTLLERNLFIDLALLQLYYWLQRCKAKVVGERKVPKTQNAT